MTKGDENSIMVGRMDQNRNEPSGRQKAHWQQFRKVRKSMEVTNDRWPLSDIGVMDTKGRMESVGATTTRIYVGLPFSQILKVSTSDTNLAVRRKKFTFKNNKRSTIDIKAKQLYPVNMVKSQIFYTPLIFILGLSEIAPSKITIYNTYENNPWFLETTLKKNEENCEKFTSKTNSTSIYQLIAEEPSKIRILNSSTNEHLLLESSTELCLTNLSKDILYQYIGKKLLVAFKCEKNRSIPSEFCIMDSFTDGRLTSFEKIREKRQASESTNENMTTIDYDYYPTIGPAEVLERTEPLVAHFVGTEGPDTLVSTRIIEKGKKKSGGSKASETRRSPSGNKMFIGSFVKK
ncbi:hypothetical protein SNEBB_005029 [Seison nebaliae]|nr:hypothetical protein SNEBB_005029 [Seison nebaliae]